MHLFIYYPSGTDANETRNYTLLAEGKIHSYFISIHLFIYLIFIFLQRKNRRLDELEKNADDNNNKAGE